jgi:ATP-dependent Clp protease adaptor protein ClpS
MAAAGVLDAELESLLDDGADEARDRVEPFTTLHLLQCLLLSDRVRAAVPAVDALMAATRGALDGATDDAQQIEAILARAAERVAGSGGDRIAATDVIIALAETPACAGGALLAAQGVTPLVLKLHVAHPPPQRPRGVRALVRWLFTPQAPAPPPITPDHPVRVVIHDDPFTTKAFVIEILERHFAAPRPEAEALTEQIHQRGIGRLSPMPYAEAARRIQEVTRLARQHGFPLRLTVERLRIGLPRAIVRRT